MKIWTEKDITELLNSNPLAVERGIKAIYSLQTLDEQQSSDTKHDNSVGFNASDARRLSYLARWLTENPNLHLKPETIEKYRPRILKYRKQLCVLANEKERRKAEQK